MYIKKT